MSGVLYSYDPGFDPDKHLEIFDRVMGEMDEGKDKLEGEREAIEDGRLVVYPVKKGVENMLFNLKIYKLVVVSNSLIPITELVLERIGLGNKAWKIFDSGELGSKKDPEMWKKIFRQLPRVDVLIEDRESNLVAAEQAARELGLAPKVFKEVPVLEDR